MDGNDTTGGFLDAPMFGLCQPGAFACFKYLAFVL